MVIEIAGEGGRRTAAALCVLNKRNIYFLCNIQRTFAYKI